MKSVLQQQLKMTKPFENLETEVFLNLVRTHSFLTVEGEFIFKEKNITSVQYNVLRILRGAGSKGLPSLEIASRMVTRVPDITRLVDRLVKQGLAKRNRSSEDRRIVYVMVTEKGKKLLKELDKPVSESDKKTFKHLSQKKLKLLNELLVEARRDL